MGNSKMEPIAGSNPSSTKSMTSRERALAVLNYQPYDRLPIVHLGFWEETAKKWLAEGHVTDEQVSNSDNLARTLGFDCGCGWDRENMVEPANWINPPFESVEISSLPDGTRHMRNADGVVVMQHPDAIGIPAEIDHLLKDRASWEEHYKWRLQWSPERITQSFNFADARRMRSEKCDEPFGLHCGSLYGRIRNVLGVEGSSYLLADDEALFDEIIDTVANLCYRNIEYILQRSDGIDFDYGHFWEDICFKNGPLISPSVFKEKVGPHYARITRLLKQHGINIVSLDCDGKIDTLVPIWMENGVNTMFPTKSARGMPALSRGGKNTAKDSSESVE